MRWTLSPLVITCCLTAVVSARPQDEERWRSQHDKALGALQQGDYPQAASLFLDAIRLAEKLGTDDVRLAESLNGLAQIYRYQQNYAEAEAQARRSLAILERALGPSHHGVLPSLINLAGITRATERYAEAEQVYRRILSVRWGTSAASGVGADQVLEKFAEVLSLAHTRDPGVERALEDFWRSISESRLDKDLYVWMRDRFLALPLVPEAESLMQRAIRLYPDSRQLRYELGELYVTWGKYQKAIEVFEEAARVGANPDPLVERQQRGLLYGRIGEMNFFLVRFDEAFTALTTALEINPAIINSRLVLGALYMRRNRFDEAVAEYRRVISADPGNAAAYDGLAQVDLALGRYVEAASDADRALEIDPGLQSSRYVKSMALIREGRDREGSTALQEYHQREAGEQIAKSRLDAIANLERTSLAMLAEERSQKAIELLREGIRSHPRAAVLYLRLGLTQSRLRLHREAAETFETMVRLKLDDFLVHRQLSREYEALGNREGRLRQQVIYLQLYEAALQTKAN